MAKKSSETMAKDIINTESYRLDGKVVKVSSSGKRTVYKDITEIKGLFFGGIEIIVDGKKITFEYSESDTINNIPCKA